MAELVVALDLATARAALELVDRLGEAVRWYKIGPVLHVADGPAVVRALRERGRQVFLDLKWHDIPNTVAGAVQAARDAGVALATVHLAGGARMLEAATQARSGGIRLVGVGVLTSLDAAGFGAVVGRSVGDLAAEQQRLVRLGVEAGLDGYVTAAAEARAVRAAAGAGAAIVVPGVRRGDQAAGDQVRTATPRQALEAGADYVVVGRPVTAAADPLAEALATTAEMER
ncbi:MAG TPA: orotidine-5'-phosphate decarboxylase [Gemmatimonadales bacterium]|nr:orotidine-5'-phosphate decarboxylase [Gemmatimonadales bacterium]